MRRHLIGILSLCLLCGGAVTWYLDTYHGIRWVGVEAACWRMGPISLAMWLAWPDVARIPKRFYWAVIVAVLLVAWRPKVMLLLLPVFAVLSILRPRGKSASSALVKASRQRDVRRSS